MKFPSPDKAIERFYFKPIRALAGKNRVTNWLLRRLPLARKAFEEPAEPEEPTGIG